MKARGILLLMLLLLAFPGAQKGSAAGLRVTHGPLAATLAANIEINCQNPALPAGFTFKVLPDASGTQAQAGDVLHSFLCNYTILSQSGQPSGMAITIDYNCPPDTQSNWAAKTSPRSNEITRTANSLLTRETGSASGFAGSFTVQEKLILLIDSHTVATIVVLTDPDPSNPNNMVFSANAGQAPAIALANAYAPQANDPACPASAASSSASGGTSQGGLTSFFNEPWEWEHLNPGTAAAIAVGVGTVAALLGGLLTGAIGTSLSTVPMGGAATAVPLSARSISSEVLPQTTSPSPAPSTYAVSSPPPEISPPITSPLPPLIESPIVEAALAAGAATAGVMSSMGASSSDTNQSDDKGGEQQDAEKPCPEVQARLFGLPAINSRNDCPGSRPSMGPWYAGIDFTSNDEHGAPANLDFDALVTGEVTYRGDSDSFNMIEVKLENGNRIQYLHASEVYVQVGQHVTHSTKLGKTGGAGSQGPNQYEIHLHVQAIDKDGNLLDPDCALASMDARKLRTGDSSSPYRERIALESDAEHAEAAPTLLIEEDRTMNGGSQAASMPEEEAASLTIPVEEVQALEAPLPSMRPEAQVPEEALAVLATPELSVPPSVVEEVQPVEPPVALASQPPLKQPLAPEAPPAPIEPEPPVMMPEELLTTLTAELVTLEPEMIVQPLPLETTSVTPPAPEQRPIYCADCGQANQRDAHFCRNCGRPIRRA